MANIVYLTKEGYDKLKKELEELKTVGRAEVVEAIAEAREKGDLSENAEYDAAKDAQGMLELKINEMETILSNARIIDKSKLSTDEVRVLSKVKIKNKKLGKSMTYQLVSESESDIKKGKISINSPIGQGLLGKKVGDEAEIKTPGGTIVFEILEISLD